ncbi:cellulose biosynthesis protein BcsD [Sodalis endosymbiont of Spalangia cameroni]|uniref:cellulose biosynthesis protein BcsD n=1 Tax=Sodalis praecaptivus TaxID=1239307 RepID=UPI0031F8C20B
MKQEDLQTSTTLDYYRQRQTQPGWQDLVGLLIAGISDNAGDEDKRQFLNLVGEQLACRFPQPAAATVGELEDGLNRLWSCFHWGYVRLTPEATALSLRHCATPAAPAGQSEPVWVAGLAAVLEGAYARWLLDQGGQRHVALRWQQDSAGGEMTFRYENSR